MFFAFNNAFGQYWEGGHDTIYSQRKYIGIGTLHPQKSLHIYKEVNLSTDQPAIIRLSTNYTKSSIDTWDIESKGSLKFKYGIGDLTSTFTSTKMLLTPSGQLALGTETPESSAILQINSIEKGILIPRMTTAEKESITAVDGLFVYDTSLQAFSYYIEESGTWQEIAIDSKFDDYLKISDFDNTVAHGISQTDTANWNVFAHSPAKDITEEQIKSWDADSRIGQVWKHDENYTILKYTNDNTGIGAEKPERAIHIFRKDSENDFSTNYKKSVIRLTNYSKKSNIQGKPGYYTWDVENDNTNFLINFKFSGSLPQEETQNILKLNKSGELYTNTLNIANGKFKVENNGDIFVKNNKPTLRLERNTSRTAWDVEATESNLNFKYGELEGENPQTKISFTREGKLTANRLIAGNFDSDNFQNPTWQTNANGDIYRLDNNVGIGTSTPSEKLEVVGTAKVNELKVGNNLKIKPLDIQFTRNDGWAYISNLGSYGLAFTTNGGSGNIRMVIDKNGKVGIGTSTPDAKLTVAGTVKCRKVKVRVDAGADFVFEPDYKLLPLTELETFVKNKKHLPEIASEKQMQENNLDLGEMNIKLLQKVEELTLYIIEQNKRIEKLEKTIK